MQIPVDLNNLPGIQVTTGGVYLAPGQATITNGYVPQKAGPIPRDLTLPLDHPDQTFTDCRTIEGWTDTVERLMNAAWKSADPTDTFRFGKSYALLPQDSRAMQGAIIVYEILSMVPGSRGKTGIERKPLLREIVANQTIGKTAGARSASDAENPDAPDAGAQIVLSADNDQTNGKTWIWAQRFDCVVRFMIYGDTWERAIDYCNRTFDLIQTYTGVFKQAGLAQLFFRAQGQDVLHDPPRVQEFPNQTLMYNVTIERQTRATYAQIQQILVTAGVINPLSGFQSDKIVGSVEGTESSPILPAA